MSTSVTSDTVEVPIHLTMLDFDFESYILVQP